MSSQKYENLQDDIRSLISDINQKFVSVDKVYGEEKKSVLRDLQRQLDEAESLYPELESEARSSPLPYRTQLTSQLKLLRQELDQLNKKLNLLTGGANFNPSHTRQQLFSSNAGASTSGFGMDSSRSRLFQMNDTLERTSDSIARSHQLAAETEQIGTEVVSELGTQREQLIRTADRLKETDSNLRTSRRILRSMYRRVITNKLILIVIILMELGILAGVVYWKFFSKKK